MAQADGEPPLVVAVCDLPTDLLTKAEKEGKIRLLTWRRGPDTPKRQTSADRAWLEKNARGASALVIIITQTVDDKFLDTIGPSLKVIATMSVGYNHIDTDATSRRGIRVGYTPYVLNDAVADVALILALSIMRHTRVAQSVVSSGKWPDLPWTPMVSTIPTNAANAQAFTGPALQGKTIGFLGFGGSTYMSVPLMALTDPVAQTVVSRLVSFAPARVLYTTSKPRKMDLKSPAFSTLANDPMISAYVQVHGKLPFEVANEPELHKLASECDVILYVFVSSADHLTTLSVLAPLSEQTKHIINADFLRAMKCVRS